MWYKIDYKKLVLLLLPTFLRKPKLIAYLQCLTKPVDELHYDWSQKREDDWYKLNHTGQRCKLRKVLNDKLDSNLRRIYIGDGTSFPRKYIYTHAERKPVYLGKMFIRSNTEYQNTGVDFIVYAPTEIVETQIHYLKYLINYYKLAGKRYRIEKI